MKRRIRLKESDLHKIVRESLHKSGLVCENQTQNQEQMAVQCLENLKQKLYPLLGGSLDQMKSTFIMKSYRIPQLKEDYDDVIDYIDEIKNLGQKMMKYFDRAEKMLNFIIKNQQGTNMQ